MEAAAYREHWNTPAGKEMFQICCCHIMKTKMAIYCVVTFVFGLGLLHRVKKRSKPCSYSKNIKNQKLLGETDENHTKSLNMVFSGEGSWYSHSRHGPGDKLWKFRLFNRKSSNVTVFFFTLCIGGHRFVQHWLGNG